jgi:hypothetical protein
MSFAFIWYDGRSPDLLALVLLFVQRAGANSPALSARPLTSVRTQLGDLRSAPTSCGVVFDPVRGKRPDHERQAGDLGTVTAGSDGVAGV